MIESARTKRIGTFRVGSCMHDSDLSSLSKGKAIKEVQVHVMKLEGSTWEGSFGAQKNGECPVYSNYASLGRYYLLFERVRYFVNILVCLTAC